MSENQKVREFNAVSLLRDAKDSSQDNYEQHTFNPRLHLIEYSAYEALQTELANLKQEQEELREHSMGQVEEIEELLGLCEFKEKLIDDLHKKHVELEERLREYKGEWEQACERLKFKQDALEEAEFEKFEAREEMNDWKAQAEKLSDIIQFFLIPDGKASVAVHEALIKYKSWKEKQKEKG